MTLVSAGLTTAAASAPGPAQPAPQASHPEKARPSPEYRVDFRAGRVDVDAKLSELELSDGVVVRVARYRLTSERLRLHRGSRGVVVEGSGELSLCPCPRAPVSIGFESVTLAPPTDVLIEKPTVYIGEVPVLWLPYLWLRSPARAGLLAPRIAYRGQDGFTAGFGFHVPVDTEAGSEVRGFDIYASGYLEGGAEIEGQWRGQNSTAYTRWDYLGEHLLQLDATYAKTTRSDATVGGRVDAIRGPRGRSGTLLLEPAARVYDRAELEVGYVSAGLGSGLGVQATAPRAGPLDSVGSWGPSAFAAYGGALGSVGSYSADLGIVQQSDPLAGARLREQVSAELTALPGPFSVQAGLFERADGLFRDDRDEFSVEVGTSLLGSLPLRRRFGERRNLEHYVTPLVGFGVSHRRAEQAAGETIVAPLGVSTSFGSWASRTGASAKVGVGLSGDGSDPRRVAEALVVTDGGSWAVHADYRQDIRQSESQQLAGMLRLGDELGLHVSGYVEGARFLDGESVPALFSVRPLDESVEWFDRAGWTGGAALGLPITRWLAMAAGADYDLSEKRLLATRTSLAFRHSCGCLGAVAWVGKRAGRDGFDMWFSLDLLP